MQRYNRHAQTWLNLFLTPTESGRSWCRDARAGRRHEPRGSVHTSTRRVGRTHTTRESAAPGAERGGGQESERGKAPQGRLRRPNLSLRSPLAPRLATGVAATHHRHKPPPFNHRTALPDMVRKRLAANAEEGSRPRNGAESFQTVHKGAALASVPTMVAESHRHRCSLRSPGGTSAVDSDAQGLDLGFPDRGPAV